MIQGVHPKLVSPYHTGFVSGRSIHENIIIVIEVMHSLHIMRSLRGYFVVKVDLSKSYAKVSWKFIWRVLKKI